MKKKVNFRRSNNIDANLGRLCWCRIESNKVWFKGCWRQKSDM